MLKLRQVTFHRFPRLQPGCTLAFHDGLTLLLGRNGAGKTTLLEFVADILSGKSQQSHDDYHLTLQIAVQLSANQQDVQNQRDAQSEALVLEIEIERTAPAISMRPNSADALRPQPDTIIPLQTGAQPQTQMRYRIAWEYQGTDYVITADSQSLHVKYGNGAASYNGHKQPPLWMQKSEHIAHIQSNMRLRERW